MADPGLFRRRLVPTARPAVVRWSSVTLLRGITTCLFIFLLNPATIMASADTLVEPPTTESNKPNCWIFTHLQKSGGTTVKEILMHNSKAKFVIFDNYQWKDGDKMAGHFLHEHVTRHRTTFVGGHTEALRRWATTSTVATCGYYTTFRHPVARLVSAYFYCQVHWRDSLCADMIVRARDVDLLTFAKHWSNFAVRQFALNFISADDVLAYARTPEAAALLPEGVKFDEVSDWYLVKLFFQRSDVQRAGRSEQKEISTTTTAEYHDAPQAEQAPEAMLHDLLLPVQALIRDDYTAVGVLEEWNTTLALFDKTFNVPGVDWRKQYAKQGRRNVLMEKNRAQEAEVLEKAWTDVELKKHMQLDLLLYEHAVDVFHRQARSHGLL